LPPSVADYALGGQVAISANGNTVLWSSASNGVLQSSNVNSTFTAVSSLPSGAVIASDKLNNSVFYGASGSVFYTSTNGGLSFSETGTLGSSNSPVKVAVNPNATGDVWISTDVGLFHSSSLGAAPVSISQITEAVSVVAGSFIVFLTFWIVGHCSWSICNERRISVSI
jgi:xyloglucan-specific exo-beta-1,4-glucanase